jgi:heme A synthase
MMSLIAWAHRILSPATLYSVIGTVLCRCVTRPTTVADRWPTTLTPGCSRSIAQSC